MCSINHLRATFLETPAFKITNISISEILFCITYMFCRESACITHLPVIFTMSIISGSSFTYLLSLVTPPQNQLLAPALPHQLERFTFTGIL